jgi:hypothetical protein
MDKKLEILNKYIDFSKDGVIKREDALKAMQEYADLQLLQTAVIYQLCECGGNERVALDCTLKNCSHPKYNKK